MAYQVGDGNEDGVVIPGKVGFYGTTPQAQPAAIADATDAATAITKLNLLLAAQRTLGVIAT